MELRVVETFLKIVELGSFSRAARRLGYTQSAVTMQVKQLEGELGVALFERVPRGALLTDAGRTFAFHAHALIEAAEAARASVAPAERAEDLTGTLRLGSAESPASALLPPILTVFAQEHPHAAVVIETATLEELAERARTGEVDAILTLDRPKTLPGFVRETLRQEEVVLVAAHNLAGRSERPLSAEELVGLPFVLTERGESYRHEFDLALAEHDLAITPVIEAGGTETLVRLATLGAGVALVPRFSAAEALASGELEVVPTTLELPAMQIQLLYRKRKWVSPLLAALLNGLRRGIAAA